MDGALIVPVASTSLVFGMDWQALIHGAAGRNAHRLARRRGATHLVVAGEAAAAAGTVRLRLQRAHRHRPMHSAAQNMALLFDTGTVALLLELGPARHWLVAVHDGAVVARTDRLFESPASASAALEELQQAYPRLTVLSGAPGSEAPGLAQIEAASTPLTRLVPLDRWKSILPRPIQWLLLLVLLALLVPRAWRSLHPPRPAQSAAGADDPAQAWRAALQKVQRRHVLHGVQGTQAVLAALHEMPVRLAGWGLAQAACSPRPGGWRCQARYERRDAQASNAGLLAAAPAPWRIEFTSMEQASASWHVAWPGQPMDDLALRSRAHDERHLLSSLQAILPAFASLRLGTPRALEVPAPRDAHGAPLPRPRHFPAYALRSVEVHGPLRSASLLLPHARAMSWRKVSLSVRQAARAGLKDSSLHVSFLGDLYEIESPRIPADRPQRGGGDGAGRPGHDGAVDVRGRGAGPALRARLEPRAAG